MNLVLYKHPSYLSALCCDSRTKPILTHTPEDPFLEIDVKGGERVHIKVESFKRGRVLQKGERMLQTGGEMNYMPQMLGVQEERSHMSLEGKDMFMLFVCLLCSNFLFPIYSNIPYKIQGEQDI